MPTHLRAGAGIFALASVLFIGSTRAGNAQVLYNVMISTTGLNGLSGQLSFELTNGNNVTPNNALTFSNFTTDATLTGGTNDNTPGTSGNLPGTVTLQDQQFFNYSRRPIVFGNIIHFTLNATTNFAAPGGPDEFAFFLVDPTNTASLVSTSDPSGTDALFSIDIDGSTSDTSTVYISNTPAYLTR